MSAWMVATFQLLYAYSNLSLTSSRCFHTSPKRTGVEYRMRDAMRKPGESKAVSIHTPEGAHKIHAPAVSATLCLMARTRFGATASGTTPCSCHRTGSSFFISLQILDKYLTSSSRSSSGTGGRI